LNIPTFANIQFVEENGYLTKAMLNYIDELNQALQNGLSDNGWTLPQVTAAQLTEIFALTGNREMPNGTMWYVTDAVPPVVVIKIDGALRKVTTTPYP